MAPFFVSGREPTLNGSFICGSDSLAENAGVNEFRPFVFSSDPLQAQGCCGARLLPALRTLLLAAVVAFALPGAHASDSRDHERARAAVEAGQVLPLPALLERLRRTHPGQVLELELEREDGRWVYEIKLLQSNGQLLKLEVDAATGQVLQVKRREDRNSGRTAEPSKEPPK